MTNLAQRELIRAVRSELIPWAKASQLEPVLLTWPLLETSRELQILPRESKKLSVPEYHPHALNPMRWPDLGLHACRYPSLGCILEGEAHILMGMTDEMARDSHDSKALHVLALRQKKFFLIPAGIPYSDSSRAHWEQEDSNAAHSRLIWMRVLPMGVVLQMCMTVQSEHADGAAVLVQSSQLSAITQVLMESATDLPQTGELVNSCLLTLLLCIDLNWPQSRELGGLSSSTVFGEETPRDIGRDTTAAGTATVSRACAYIRANLTRSLTPQEIARNAFISVPHLKRLFRSELDTSVMKYVAHSRLEEAKALLAETDVPISEIGELCGYRHRTHFSRLFAREIGLPPREFRVQHRSHPTSANLDRT